MNCPYCNQPMAHTLLIYAECKSCSFYPLMVDWALNTEELISAYIYSCDWVTFHLPNHKIIFYPNVDEIKIELWTNDGHKFVSLKVQENITPNNVEKYLNKFQNLRAFL